jgi:hypothetical protein
MTHCIITGCELRFVGSPEWVAGDLHIQGDTFIFNGNMAADCGGPNWLYEEHSHYTKKVTLVPGWDYFERRGVFVMRASRSLLNPAANEYTKHEYIPE